MVSTEATFSDILLDSTYRSLPAASAKPATLLAKFCMLSDTEESDAYPATMITLESTLKVELS